MPKHVPLLRGAQSTNRVMSLLNRGYAVRTVKLPDGSIVVLKRHTSQLQTT